MCVIIVLPEESVSWSVDIHAVWRPLHPTVQPLLIFSLCLFVGSNRTICDCRGDCHSIESLFRVMLTTYLLTGNLSITIRPLGRYRLSLHRKRLTRVSRKSGTISCIWTVRTLLRQDTLTNQVSYEDSRSGVLPSRRNGFEEAQKKSS